MNMKVLRVVESESASDQVVGEIIDEVARLQLRIAEGVAIREGFVRLALDHVRDTVAAESLRAYARVLDSTAAELSANVKLLLTRLERLS
jgi:hypothetical protein